MCGIFGVVGSELIDNQSFLNALRTLEHRGPDSEGVEFFNTLALGFVRLSIQDLSDHGRQPMHDKSGAIYIVFNGEIYNS